MNRQMKGLLYFFITDVRKSVLIFWTILLSILVVAISFANFLLNVEDGKMYFGLPYAIYVYCSILGFLTVKESIPFSLKMGATRKNLFISIGLFFIGLSLLNALLASTLQSIISFFTSAAGIHTFRFIHLSEFLQDTWLTRVIIDTSIMFFLLSFMFILGLLFYKYGLVGGGTVTGIIVIALLLGIAKGWVFDFFSSLFASFDIVFFYQILVVGIVVYAISFIFLRRISLVKVK